MIMILGTISKQPAFSHITIQSCIKTMSKSNHRQVAQYTFRILHKYEKFYEFRYPPFQDSIPRVTPDYHKE